MESSALAVLGKFLWLPFMAAFAFFARQFFNNIEKKNESLFKQQSSIKDSIVNLEKDLNKNYYDKQEIKEHIVQPLMDRFTEVDKQVKTMSVQMNEVHASMMILRYKVLGEDSHNQ